MVDDAPKRGLGRGLESLFDDGYANDAASPDAAGASQTVPIEALSPGPFQPRRHFDDDSLGQLAESIARHGLLQPILVRRDARGSQSYQIIAGERRWRAAQRARLHEVPVVIRDMDDRDTLEVALVENIQRQDLTPLEEADGYRRLIEEFVYTQEALSKAVGRSRSHIANSLRLLGLPDPIKRMVEDGRLSAGHARALLTAPDPQAIAEEIIHKGLTVRDVERRVAEPRKIDKKSTKPIVKDVNILALENEMTDILGFDVGIDHRGQKGAITIRYDTLDQFDMIVNRLTGRQ